MSIEYALIKGINDQTWRADLLADLVEGQLVHVNLIPLNPTSGFAGTAAAEGAGHEFQRILLGADIPCTFRQRRGIDVGAGCGQLKAEKVRAGRGQT